MAPPQLPLNLSSRKLRFLSQDIPTGAVSVPSLARSSRPSGSNRRVRWTARLESSVPLRDNDLLLQRPFECMEAKQTRAVNIWGADCTWTHLRGSWERARACHFRQCVTFTAEDCGCCPSLTACSLETAHWLTDYGLSVNCKSSNIENRQQSVASRYRQA